MIWPRIPPPTWRRKKKNKPNNIIIIILHIKSCQPTMSSDKGGGANVLNHEARMELEEKHRRLRTLKELYATSPEYAIREDPYMGPLCEWCCGNDTPGTTQCWVGPGSFWLCDACLDEWENTPSIEGGGGGGGGRQEVGETKKHTY
jgi:hypothetical protein